MNKTKTYAAVALCLTLAFGMSSCKSNESLYKKAYEKAQAANQSAQQTEQVTEETATATDTNVRVQRERVQLIDGTGLKTYSVVCGSFRLLDNAIEFQQTLMQDGYQAQITVNLKSKYYYVIASTYDDKGQAVESRNSLRATCRHAWLLREK